jgi:hypothetical protein
MASKDSADDELVAVTAAGFLALLPLAELGESSTRSSSSTRTSTAAGFLALLPLAELGESSRGPLSSTRTSTAASSTFLVNPASPWPCDAWPKRAFFLDRKPRASRR